MTAIAKLTDRFTETEIDDEIVVMKLDSGDFFSITGTGRAIWRLIDGARDRAALVAALLAEFPEGGEAIPGDVDAFLHALQGEGLLAAG